MPGKLLPVDLFLEMAPLREYTGIFDLILISFFLKPSPHSVHGIYCSPADGNPILLTAGSDMKIRYNI